MTSTINAGKPNTMHVKVPVGESFVIDEGVAGDKWDGTYVLTVVHEHILKLESTISHKGEVVGHPKVQFPEGEVARIEVGNKNDTADYALAVVVRSSDTSDVNAAANTKTEAAAK